MKALKYRTAFEISGYSCELLSIDDGFDRSVTEHNVIGFDGAVQEDNGRGTRNFTLSLLFCGDNYTRHSGLLAKMNTGGLIDFMHPEYGQISAQVKKVDIKHDVTREDAVTLDVDVAEIGKAAFNATPAGVSAQVAAHYVYVLWEGARNVAKELPRQPTEAYESMMNAYARLKSAVQTTQNYVSTANVGLNAAVANVQNVLGMPGDIVAQAALACSGVASAGYALTTAPAGAVRYFMTQANNLIKTFGVDGISTAIRLGAAVAVMTMVSEIADSATKKQTSSGAANAVSGSGSSKQVTDTTTRPVTRSDLEQIIGMVRNYVGASGLDSLGLISENRGSTVALAAMLSTLTDAVLSVAANLGDTRTVNVVTPSNLYAVMLAAGVHHSRADEVISLNGIKRPNQVSGLILLPAEVNSAS